MSKIAKKVIISLFIIVIFSFVICNIFLTVETSKTIRKIPIYSVETNEKVIAISFDAAWGMEHTENILNILDNYNVKTTFFLVGFWIDKYPNVVKEIDRRGHEIGSHSETHSHMNSLSSQNIISELESVEKKLENIIGKKPYLFRAPFGEYNNNLLDTCNSKGYYVIQWDVDSLDWKKITADQIAVRVIKRAKPGSIVLFHNNAQFVEEYLPVILETLLQDGYKIIPISELIYKKDYYIDNTGRQHKNSSNTQ